MMHETSSSKSLCDWCKERTWRFRCIICDPRKIKHTCARCTVLWHSNGFSQEHLLHYYGDGTRSHHYLSFRALRSNHPELLQEGNGTKAVPKLIVSVPSFSISPTLTQLLERASTDHHAQREILMRVWAATKIEEAQICVAMREESDHSECITLASHAKHYKRKQLCSNDPLCNFIHQIMTHILSCRDDQCCYFCTPAILQQQSVLSRVMRSKLDRRMQRVSVHSQEQTNAIEEEITSFSRTFQLLQDNIDKWKENCSRMNINLDSIPMLTHFFDRKDKKRAKMPRLHEHEITKILKLPDSVHRRQSLSRLLAFGFSIVDAAFCFETESNQCLLQCRLFLPHIQHHNDRTICEETICLELKEHFGHVQKCQADRESSGCEYCLRVKERSITRLFQLRQKAIHEAEGKWKAARDAMQEDKEGADAYEGQCALAHAEEMKTEAYAQLDAVLGQRCQVREIIEQHDFGRNFIANYKEPPLHFTKSDPSHRK